MKEIEKMLMKWNDGVFRGAKLRLSKELKVTDSAISAWLSGRVDPAIDKIEKMAKLFNTNEAHIRAVFGMGERINRIEHRGDNYNNGGEIHYGDQIKETQKSLKDEIERIKLKIENIELKLDLLLEKTNKRTRKK
jgi:transcriptional regulator with XRE-family HTH domain